MKWQTVCRIHAETCNSYLSSFYVPDVDALVLVQWDGLSLQDHLNSGRRDVFDRAPQHPTISGPTKNAPPLQAFSPFLLVFHIGLLFLLLAERTGEREEEDGEKG